MLLCFDTETGGTDVFNDRIVQLFVGVYDDDGEMVEYRDWLMDPGVDIPEGASNIHGFTTEMIRDRVPPAKQVLEEAREFFLKYLDIPWVAFNMNFDLSILDAEFKRYGISDMFGTHARDNLRLIDPLVIDRAKDRYRKGKRNLEAMARHYGVPFDADAAHKADYDVAVTAKVALAVTDRYGVPSTQEQAQWYRDWAENFEQYLRKTDPGAVVDKDWPLRLKEEA